MNTVIQALLASIMGASHGWLCSGTVSVRSILGRLRIRSRRLCDGLRRVRNLVARDHANPNRGADRRLRPLHARLWRVEIAANTELANYCAVRLRRYDRRS